jgi:hypothetical protein
MHRPNCAAAARTLIRTRLVVLLPARAAHTFAPEAAVKVAVLGGLWAAVTTLAVFEFPTAAIVLGLTGIALALSLRIRAEGVCGALGGAGAICLLIGLLNLGNARSCSSQAASCGGGWPLPVFVLGLLLLPAGAGLYMLNARRIARRDQLPGSGSA